MPQIEYRNSTSGDIFDADVEALVNSVNCVGIMGKGIALKFKKKYPQNYIAYKEACEGKLVTTGKMFFFSTNQMLNPKYVINFPTKDHWRGNSNIDYINRGMDDLVRLIREMNITSIAIPPLGCGLGGLLWSEVKSIIEDKVKDLGDVRIVLFEP